MTATAQDACLQSYPKSRPVLPEAYRAIYDNHILESRRGARPMMGLAYKLEQWMHCQVARSTGKRKVRILELGAGGLNHVRFEKHASGYDVVEPFTALLETGDGSRVEHQYRDIREVPPSRRYDKILSIAVLEHLCDLPEVIARTALMLDDDGVFTAGIPSEGTPLWRLGWTLTTGREFRARHGLDYGVLMSYEHVNTAAEIAQVTRFFFEEARVRAFGPTPGLSLYQCVTATRPRLQRCREYLGAGGKG